MDLAKRIRDKSRYHEIWPFFNPPSIFTITCNRAICMIIFLYGNRHSIYAISPESFSAF